MSAHVPLPQFVMRDGTPVSAVFDDVYFSRAGGIAETEHVFLRGNGLPERFAHHTDFHIAELGFGTGLNFLVTWKAFVAHAPQDAHLHYLAVEKFPLTPAMLTEALTAYPELAEYASALIAAYPLRLPGWHRIHMPRTTLTLGFGDAEALLCASRLMGVSPPKPPPSFARLAP
jgi:tRNA 5-methylaminomethyl-2-thiouridine biosynthesis bifunctional protein